ncbi:Dynamin domain-containing protein [Desulfonema limicola]|uniref:Dynamin domain-containing protein n=1 Tax=Desulfonema limicola TaxID=45656 RepID=A0A975BBY9_9BACT|nr:dynamin family protein [Desulfonema limicola]QTA82449.1 Dynamin domain-containing protein [Desulfonema limicola]
MSSKEQSSINLSKALCQLEQSLKPQIQDSDITVRIIGEFSSGKSRLVRELFKDIVPDNLLPVSRRARETLVPLEITYGDEIALWEIQREQDEKTKPEYIRKWEHFPQRGEFEFSEHELKTHRLRLTLPQKELRIDKHPFNKNSKGQFRIFLIDTPGWNSGELDSSRDTLTGEMILASIYVIQAVRIDSRDNEDELHTLLSEIKDRASFLERENLMVYVTHWFEDKNHSDLKDRFEARLRKTAEKAGFDDMLIQTEYLDFDNMDKAGRLEFRKNFWKKFNKGFSGTSDPVFSPEKIIETWNLTPQLRIMAEKITQTSQILEKFRTGDEFIPGMNMTRLKAYPQAEWQERLWCKWNLSVNSDNNEELIELENSHPLSAWWNQILLNRVRTGLKQTDNLIQSAFKTLSQLNVTIENLNEFIKEKLELAYEETQQKYLWTESLFPPSLVKIINENGNQTKILATLIAITICQSEIEDAVYQMIQ